MIVAVVTLGFDDGSASHFTRRSILDEHGVKATFFLNTARLGQSGYMTWAQAAQLAAEGHEIGGHTLDHVRLPGLPLAEQQRQVCDDRAALLAHGFEARNFAYPHGANDATTKSVVIGCGYATARTTGGTDYPRDCCVFAETVPPKDPYRLRAIQPRLTTPLATYQDVIDRARYSGGGWVNFVLHNICDDPCAGASEYAIPASTLDALLDWIATQPGVTVRTTAQALRQPPDTRAPTVSLTAPSDGATVEGTVALQATAADDIGVHRVEFRVNGSLVGTDTTAPYGVDWRSGPPGSTATIAATAYDPAGNATTSASRTVTVATDTTAPAAALTTPADGATVSGSSVSLAGTATDAVGVTLVEFLVDGAVVGTDTSAPYGVSWNSTRARASSTVAMRARDAAGNVTTTPARTITVLDVLAPTVSLTAPAAGATVRGTVAVSASASDDRGVAAVEFLVNGIVIGTDTLAPYSVSWRTTTLGNATLQARARDAAGNTATSASRTVRVTL